MSTIWVVEVFSGNDWQPFTAEISREQAEKQIDALKGHVAVRLRLYTRA
jgi:hypothetical protein